MGNFEECIDRIQNCDKRMKQIYGKGLSNSETPFSSCTSHFPIERPIKFPLAIIDKLAGIAPNSSVTCEWDNSNPASVRCLQCQANYCPICDEVLHRHHEKRTHERVPIESPPSPKSSKKNKKRKKNEKCRCGTGATKGTLGDPCTGKSR